MAAAEAQYAAGGLHERYESMNPRSLSFHDHNSRFTQKQHMDVRDVAVRQLVQASRAREAGGLLGSYCPPTSNHLVSSPYTDIDHSLDLSTLSQQENLLARALTVLEPRRADYATADYLQSFNWDLVLSTLITLSEQENHTWTRQEFYTVIFRSQLKEDCDRGRLFLLDERSHYEAALSGGLLKYWFGSTDAQNRNLATCVWRNRVDARNGGTGPWHKKARLAARDLYESIDFSTWTLIIEDGAAGIRLEKVTEHRLAAA